MLARLTLLFIAVPIAELALLIWLGGLIGFWPTLGLVVVTGAAGAALARASGVKVLLQIRAEVAAGRMPVGHMLDGALVLVGGLLLLTPGLLSDLAGLALLVPASRALIGRFARRKLQQLVETQRVRIVRTGGWPGGTAERAADVDTPSGRRVDIAPPE
jgi:UPF0716 protein FxsA